MALNPYDYDEVDRPNAFKSRKKSGAWCKGTKGIKCEFETINYGECMWAQTPFRVTNGKKRMYWKCLCKTICKRCTKNKNRWSNNKVCLHGMKKYATMPSGPDIQISNYAL